MKMGTRWSIQRELVKVLKTCPPLTLMLAACPPMTLTLTLALATLAVYMANLEMCV
jgi:hypothetical protein